MNKQNIVASEKFQKDIKKFTEYYLNAISENVKRAFKRKKEQELLCKEK